MKWDFFYNEDDGKTHESIQDWYKDIKRLTAPTIVMTVLGIAVLSLFPIFPFLKFKPYK
jgi:hypothetical protein